MALQSSVLLGRMSETSKAILFSRSLRTLWALPRSSSMATMKVVSASEQPTEDFYKKNERLQRPMSPHLTIYKFQVTSVLSITHRFTGLFQSGLLSGAAIAAMTLPGTFPHYLLALQGMHLGGAVIFATKFVLAWPFAFHILNGVRHLSWDMGWGFQIHELYKTGYAVLALSVLLAGVLSSI